MLSAWHEMQSAGSTPFTGAWHAAQLFDRNACDCDSAPGTTACCHSVRVLELLRVHSRPRPIASRMKASAITRTFVLLMLRKPPQAILKPMAPQLNLPEWLADVQDAVFDSAKQVNMKTRKRSPTQEVEKRLMDISALLEMENEILSSANPLAAIGRIGRKQIKHVHVARLQLWFFAYILYGRNIWALKPPTHNNGTWSRQSEQHKDTLFGRPSLDKGAGHGWSSHRFRRKKVGQPRAAPVLSICMSKNFWQCPLLRRP